MRNQVLHVLLPTENTSFKIVEVANWIGKVFVVPRANLKDLKDRGDSNNPGIYFLFGDSDQTAVPRLYIGETENFLNRITTHDQNKDFWNIAVIFIGGIDKAKIKYLEYLANKDAAVAERFFIENTAVPKKPHLAEFDELAILDYYEKVKFILSALGYPVFDSVAESLADKKIYYLKADGADAKAQLLEDGSLNVLKGSLARVRETNSFLGWSQNARRQFTQDGTFENTADGISYMYTKDVLFSSPTAAAATTTGRPINGWISWKDEQGNTLDENLRK